MSRVLVLSPHPDDEALGCGGTLCKHVRAGDVVEAVFLTSGEQGGHGRAADETRRIRVAEARRAAKILGIKHIEFWGEPDGALHVTRRLVDRLRTMLKESRPDIVYLPHDRETHPDHRAAGRLLRAALRDSQGRPMRPTIRMFEVWTPIQRLDEVVDISPYIQTKLRAIRAYRSQCEVLKFDDAMLGLSRYRGEMHSWPGGDYAEVFMVQQ